MSLPRPTEYADLGAALSACMATMELASDAMFLLDRAGSVFHGVNASACAALGRSREQVVERGPALFDGWHAACSDIYRPGHRADTRECPPLVQACTPDGSVRQFRIRRVARLAELGWIVAALDVTGALYDAPIDAVPHRHADYSRLAAELLQTHDDERNRLATALHGDIGQLLAALRINLDLMRQLPEDAAAGSKMLENLDKLILSSIASVRRMSSELYPKGLKEGDLAAALQALANEVAARQGFVCEVDADADLDALAAYEPRHAQIYRTVEDALTNVLPALAPQTVRVRLVAAPGSLAIKVCAAAVQNRTGLPVHRLLGLRERMRLLDGSLHVQSDSCGSVEVCLRVPAPRS